MGSLGSRDGVGLFLDWMLMNRRIAKPPRSGSVGSWNSIAAKSSRYGLGLFAQQQFGEFLSSSDFHKRCKSSLDRHDNHHSPDQHDWTGWLHAPLSGSGLIRDPLDWRLRLLTFRPWSSWYLMQQGGPINNSSKGNKIVVLSALGGVSNEGSPSESSDKSYPSRTLTNLIIGLNILVFVGQIASKGKLLLLGAKVNDLINQGQFWRLVTPSVLHANIFHLLVNGYSLHSIGPTVESLAGPRRFLAVYSVSALTSTTLSYYLCSAPSVGASGAIFGLVGALAVFLIRHKNMMVGGQRSLQQVARVIAVNMLLGLVSDGIDNWSHFGGLVGGAAITWLLGPVYSFEMPPGGGKRQLVDRPPISYLLHSQVRGKQE